MSEIGKVPGVRGPIAPVKRVAPLPKVSAPKLAGDGLSLSKVLDAPEPPLTELIGQRADVAACAWLAAATKPNTDTELDEPQPAVTIVPNDMRAGKAWPAEVLKQYPQLEALQGVLRIEGWDDPVIRKHVADLAQYPPGLLKALKAYGLNDLHIGPRPMPFLDSNEGVQGIRPRGWPKGLTWSSVAGGYNSVARSVAAGKADVQDGASSLLQHELGHAVGEILGFNDDPYVKGEYDRLFAATVPNPCKPGTTLPKLDPYLRQTSADGDRSPGRHEFFAESIAVYLTKGRAAAVDAFDERWVEYLEADVFGYPAPTDAQIAAYKQQAEQARAK